MKQEYKLSEVLGNEYRDWALYTIENRAIPSMIDGMKSVQRFFLYASLKNSRVEFKKVSAVGGVLSDYGYNHAETSGMGAGSLMAATWNNNICLVEGRGNFGSRLIQAAGAPRYIYTRLHQNFNHYIKDIDLAPIHPDPEHAPPSWYMPVIPLVLANGASGIATGFATNILPRDPADLKRCCAEWCKTGKVSTNPKLKFPESRADVSWDDDKQNWVVRGKVELQGKTTALITEVPPNYDREGYIKVLDRLDENDEIVGYEDQCAKEFRFEIKLKRGKPWSEERLVKLLRLEKTYAENLTVIDESGRLKEYTDPRTLIEDFCEVRTRILQARIDLRLEEARKDLIWLKYKRAFIQLVLDDKIPFRNTKLTDLEKFIDAELGCGVTVAADLLKIRIAGLSQDQVKDLSDKISETEKLETFWQSTTPKKQFIEDLRELSI